MKALLTCLMVVVLAAGCDSKGDAQDTTSTRESAGTAHSHQHVVESQTSLSPSQEAMAQAQAANASLVAYFYRGRAQRKQVDKAIQKARQARPEGAHYIAVEATNPEEQAIARKCGVTRVPFTSVVAPNGAVTARFPGVARIDQIRRGFVSPGMAELLRAMQNDSAVFLCLTNDRTAHAEQVHRVTQTAVDRLGGIAELIDVDPSDPQEALLLKQVKVDPDTAMATTVVIASSGTIVEKFVGTLTTRDLFNSFEKIMTGSGSCGAPTATGGSACDPAAGVGGGHEACE